MCRRITGYILYRCNLNLNKKIQKAASKAGKEETVKKYVAMREMVTTVFTAVRDEVKDDMSSKEIEFYQNSAYALTNPSDEFFLFAQKLNSKLMLCIDEHKHEKTVIPDTKKNLLSSEAVKTHFLELCANDNEEMMLGEVTFP